MEKPKAHCEAVTASGEPCRMPRLHGEAYCWAHSPQRERERAEARKRGGLARAAAGAEPVPLETVADVQALLALAAGDVAALPPSIARARTVAYIAGTALKMLELSAIEARIAHLEQRLSSEGWR